MERDKLYQLFGPLLIEAVVLVLGDEINMLRKQNGFPELTHQQIMDSIGDRLSNLTWYDWMSSDSLSNPR